MNNMNNKNYNYSSKNTMEETRKHVIQKVDYFNISTESLEKLSQYCTFSSVKNDKMEKKILQFFSLLTF